MKVNRSGGADPDGNQPGDLYVTIKVLAVHHNCVLSSATFEMPSAGLDHLVPGVA